MKIFIPKNIERGLLSGKLSIGPLSVSLIQLFILAGGLALSLGIWNSLIKSGLSKAGATIMASPVFIFFLILAFFNFSELGFFSFIAKVVRTYILDEPRKFQVNYKKLDPLEIATKKIKNNDDKKQVIEIKKSTDINKQNIDKLKGILDNI